MEADNEGLSGRVGRACPSGSVLFLFLCLSSVPEPQRGEGGVSGGGGAEGAYASSQLIMFDLKKGPFPATPG